MIWKTFKPKRTQRPRTHHKYAYWQKGRIKHKGITTDLEEREKQHQQKWPGGHIKKIGRITNEEAARESEKKQGVS